jgi:hypothetical protein
MPAVRWRHRAAEGHNLPRRHPGDPFTTPLRVDALKVLLSFRAAGRRNLAAMLELLTEPSTVTVVPPACARSRPRQHGDPARAVRARRGGGEGADRR